MLWVKSLHIVFIASWFAGLFYLPRIFVNLAMVPPESVAERETPAAHGAQAPAVHDLPGARAGAGGDRLPPRLRGAPAPLHRRREPAQPPLVPLVQRTAGAAVAGHRDPGGGQALLSRHRAHGGSAAAQVRRAPAGARLRGVDRLRQPVPVCRLARPGIAPWAYLWAPWPKYWTGFDFSVNVAGYVPFGFLCALAVLRTGKASRVWHAVVRATVAGAAVSFAMETLQSYLPARIPSNVDLGLNRTGAGRARSGSPRIRAARWCSWRSGLRAALSGRRHLRAGAGVRAARGGDLRVASRHALHRLAAAAAVRTRAAGAGGGTAVRDAGRAGAMPAGLPGGALGGSARGAAAVDAAVGRRGLRVVGGAELRAGTRLGLAGAAGAGARERVLRADAGHLGAGALHPLPRLAQWLGWVWPYAVLVYVVAALSRRGRRDAAPVG
ncbi:hypothetical protein DdX_21400 [Ditylenchus destructor]|uniref:Protoporphyrinogen IX oxidase n=1 Tax=Ditylenchus destructor TaxID=166010 RepID=A0AAD4MFL8_9BILA|nr:hypothetical protein DdX_21400 [Ditylenchus destructor]